MSWWDKHITLVYLPQETSEVKKIRLPLHLFILLVLALAGGIFTWGWVVYDYFTLRANLAFLEQNKRAFFEVNNEVETYDARYQDADHHLQHLNELHYKLRVLTSLEKPAPAPEAIEEEARVQNLLKAKKDSILSVIAQDVKDEDHDIEQTGKQLATLLSFLAEEASPLKRIPSIWPVKGLLTTEFGRRADRLTGQVKPQHGVVFATRSFAPVLATAEGIVEYAGPDEVLENLIVVDHGNGLKTRYGNVGTPEVAKDQIVRQGAAIAQVANTGRTSGPQLYYEILFDGVPQNPVKFIRVSPSEEEL